MPLLNLALANFCKFYFLLKKDAQQFDIVFLLEGVQLFFRINSFIEGGIYFLFFC